MGSLPCSCQIVVYPACGNQAKSLGLLSSLNMTDFVEWLVFAGFRNLWLQVLLNAAATLSWADYSDLPSSLVITLFVCSSIVLLFGFFPPSFLFPLLLFPQIYTLFPTTLPPFVLSCKPWLMSLNQNTTSWNHASMQAVSTVVSSYSVDDVSLWMFKLNIWSYLTNPPINFGN